MASSGRVRPALLILGVALAGTVADAAWRGGLWGLLAGSLLATGWCGVLALPAAARSRFAPSPGDGAVPADEVANRLLLDVAPVPMVAIDAGDARALNRAARRLFATDDRIRDAPAALFDPRSSHASYEARRWRIDRVMLGSPPVGRMVAALVDVEGEERIAEARASADMIHVLGHELLNGLAPIASLAESGEAVLASPEPDLPLLREMLETLARRAEGLRRFAEAYRALARLPEPERRPVALRDLAADLSRLFGGTWPTIALHVAADHGRWPLDRDQMMQAAWALLQNAAEAAGDTGRVWLRLRIEGTSLLVEVADSGEGLAPGDAAYVFRPFYTTKPDGTGIGLSLARQIATAHGGALTLSRRAPTTFRIQLPQKAGIATDGNADGERRPL